MRAQQAAAGTPAMEGAGRHSPTGRACAAPLAVHGAIVSTVARSVCVGGARAMWRAFPAVRLSFGGAPHAVLELLHSDTPRGYGVLTTRVRGDATTANWSLCISCSPHVQGSHS